MNKLPSISATPASPGSPGLSEIGHAEDKQGIHHSHTIGAKPPTFGHFKNKCQHDIMDLDAKAIVEEGLGQKQNIYSVFNKYTK